MAKMKKALNSVKHRKDFVPYVPPRSTKATAAAADVFTVTLSEFDPARITFTLHQQGPENSVILHAMEFTSCASVSVELGKLMLDSLFVLLAWLNNASRKDTKLQPYITFIETAFSVLTEQVPSPNSVYISGS